MKPYIEAEITRQGLGARVHWTGYLHDVRGLIVASAATVLPSSREGLSRVVLESLALGTPVIGTTVRGIQDSVHPDGGILVPPGDVDALARAFERVAGGPLFDDATASRVRRRLERFSLPSIVRSHEVLYEQLLRDRPGPRSLGPHSSRKRNSDGRVLTGSPGSIA